MSALITKDDDLRTSAPVVGFEILFLLKESPESRVTIFDVVRKLDRNKKISVRSVYYGMIFLYSLDLIDFEEPYLVHHAKD